MPKARVRVLFSSPATRSAVIGAVMVFCGIFLGRNAGLFGSFCKKHLYVVMILGALAMLATAFWVKNRDEGISQSRLARWRRDHRWVIVALTGIVITNVSIWMMLGHAHINLVAILGVLCVVAFLPALWCVAWCGGIMLTKVHEPKTPPTPAANSKPAAGAGANPIMPTSSGNGLWGDPHSQPHLNLGDNPTQEFKLPALRATSSDAVPADGPQPTARFVPRKPSTLDGERVSRPPTRS